MDPVQKFELQIALLNIIAFFFGGIWGYNYRQQIEKLEKDGSNER